MLRKLRHISKSGVLFLICFLITGFPQLIAQPQKDARLSPTTKIEPALQSEIHSGNTQRIPVVLYLAEQPFQRVLQSRKQQIASDLAIIETELERLRQWDIRSQAGELQPAALNKLLSDHGFMADNISDAIDTQLRQRDNLVDNLHSEVLIELRQLNNGVQQSVTAAIEAAGGRLAQRHQIINALSAIVPANTISTLARNSDVAGIYLDRKFTANLDTSVPAMNTGTFWTNGFTGGTIDIAFIDSGVDDTHPALTTHGFIEQRFLATADIVEPGLPANDPTADDISGHGTHIAGIASSTNMTNRGVSYGHDRIINAKAAFDLDGIIGGNSSMYWSDMLAAVEWAAMTAGADVINFSFGGAQFDGSYTPQAEFWDAVVVDLGKIVSMAAGNFGSSGSESIINPAFAQNVITVGNMNDNGTITRSDDVLHPSSSYFATSLIGAEYFKPDLVAPGTNITSTNGAWEFVNDYFSDTGTSFAAPHIAGAAALLLQAGHTDPLSVKAVLLNNADHTAVSGDKDGAGYVDLSMAYNNRNNYFIDAVAENGNPNDRDFFLGPVNTGDKVTIVFHKHSEFAGGAYPTVNYRISNLGFFGFDATDIPSITIEQAFRRSVNRRVFSTSYDSLVIVPFAFQVTGPLAEEPYALATPPGWQQVTPPQITISADPGNPSFGIWNTDETLTYHFTNNGDLPAEDVDVDLIAPAGLSIISSPSAIPRIEPGTTRNASWTVRGTTFGLKNFTVEFFADNYNTDFEGTIADNILITVILPTDLEPENEYADDIPMSWCPGVCPPFGGKLNGGPDILSYSVHRSLQPSIGYSIIADNLTRSYYRDSGLENGTTYYYLISALMDDGTESFITNIQSGTPSEGGNILEPGLAAQPPEIDGVIDPDEWTEATVIDIADPDADGSVLQYMMTDGDFLYIALDDQSGVDHGDNSVLRFYVDANMDREWPQAMQSGAPEGILETVLVNNKFKTTFTTVEGYWPDNLRLSGPMVAKGVVVEGSESGDSFQGEIAIPLTMLGEAGINNGIGWYTTVYSGPEERYSGYWPTSLEPIDPDIDRKLLPILYGDIRFPENKAGNSLARVDNNGLPLRMALVGNYPNPFNPETQIRYQISDIKYQNGNDGRINLAVFDILGRKVRTLVNEIKQPGSYTVSWDGRDDNGREVAGGIYFYHLTAGEFQQVRKMIYLK